MKKIVPDNAILIPDNAERVFQGQIFDVYQWPQKMFDGSTKTFEMLRRPDTIEIVAVKDGKIILVNDEQPGRSARIHFPGGRADEEDESWLIGAKREMLEETGMQFSSWKLIVVEQPLPKAEWFVPFYLATDFESQGEQQLDADGEKIAVMAVSFEKLRQRVLSGDEQTMEYAIPLLTKCPTLDDLLEWPEFQGKEIDR